MEGQGRERSAEDGEAGKAAAERLGGLTRSEKRLYQFSEAAIPRTINWVASNTEMYFVIDLGTKSLKLKSQ